MGNWPSFLINLAEDRVRLADSGAQLKALNIPFERVEAVNGRTLSDEQVAKVYDSRANLRRARAPLLRSEIGCYLSHVKVWNLVTEGDAEGGIVFEDDFHAHDDLAEVLDLLPRHMHDFDMMKLCSHRSDRSYVDRRSLGPKHQIATPYRIPNSTAAYALTKDAAQRLAMLAAPFFRPVDEDLKWFWEKDLKVGVVLPLPVDFGNKESAVGSIGDERSAVRKRRGRRFRVVHSFRTLLHSARYEALLHFHRSKEKRQQS